MELNSPFMLNDLSTLQLLQRALLEARFFSGARGPELPGSPLLAALHGQVVKCIADHYEEVGDETAATRLESWLQWSAREAERDSLVATLAGMNGWFTMDREQQLEIASTLMAPFAYTEQDVEQVVADVEAGEGT